MNNPYTKSPVAQNVNQAINQNIQVNLKSVLFVQVPAENAAHYRPQVMTMDDQSFRRIRDLTGEGNGLNIDAQAIRKVARDILRPSDQSQGQIAIENDWSTTRFAFYMLFEVVMPSVTTNEVLTGYTNHLGVTESRGANSRYWDPTMTLNINSHMRIARRETYNTHGAIVTATGAEVHQILRPTHVMQNNQAVSVQAAAIAMRPTDILAAAQVHVSGGRGSVNDTRHVVKQGEGKIGRASNRTNEISSEALSKVLASYSQAHSRQGQSLGGEQWMLGTAATYAREEELDTSILIRRLTENTVLGDCGYVTFSELEYMFPYIHDVLQPVMLPLNGQVIHDNAQYYRGWGAPDAHTTTAHAMVHAIPSLLTRCMMSSISFTLHNHTPDGRPDVQITKLATIFETQNDEMFYDQFASVLINDLVPELFPDAHQSFDITMAASLFGLSKISISLDGLPADEFTAPNYADGLTSSALGVHVDQLDDAAGKTTAMLGEVFNASVDPGIATRYSHY